MSSLRAGCISHFFAVSHISLQTNSPTISSCGSTQQAIEHSEQKECDIYSRLFFEEARKAEETGNTKAKEVFALLGGIASLMFTLDNKESPFGPMVVWHDRRSFIVDDLTDEQLKVLGEIAPDVKDPEMQARIADALWIRTRNFRMAGLAVDSYLESAATLEHPENWVQCARRTERALQLAAALGKNNQYFPKTIQHIEHLLLVANHNYQSRLL